MTEFADMQERELQFIEASDDERLRLLSIGQAPATDRMIYLALQALARVILAQPLGPKGGK